MTTVNFSTLQDTKVSIDNSGIFEWINLDKIELVYEWAFRNAKTIADVEKFLLETPEYTN